MNLVVELQSALETKFNQYKNHFPNAFKNLKDFKKNLKNAPIKEYPEHYFNADNLLNTSYHNLNFRNYEIFYNLCTYKNGSKGDCQGVLKGVMENKFHPPIVLKGSNEIFWLLAGNVEMMAYKLLGIAPTVKQIDLSIRIKP